MESLLILYAIVFIAAMLALIFIPWIRGRGDLINTWTLVLLGAINFVGLSIITNLTRDDPYHYADYQTIDYLRFMAGVTAFFAVMALTYHYLKLPRRLAGRTLRKWPPLTMGVLYFMLPLCVIMALGRLFPPPIIFVGHVCAILGDKAAAFGLVLALVLWCRQPSNPVLIATVVFMSLLCAGMSMYGGSGRRGLVNLVFAVPLCLYWCVLRYKSLRLNLALLTAAGVLFIMVVAGYTGVRHRYRDTGEKRNFVYVLRSLRMIPHYMFDKERVVEMFYSDTYEISLLAIHMYTGEAKDKRDPFAAAKFILANPVPRVVWEDKPKGLGWYLPHRDYQIKGASSHFTWGPGIVGHGYYEGGLIMLVFYGLAFGFVLRFVDDLLMRQPGNPYVLGMIAASAGHLMGWVRGDIGTFAMQIIGAFVAGWVLARAGRFIFGTIAYPRTDHLYINRSGVTGVSKAYARQLAQQQGAPQPQPV